MTISRRRFFRQCAVGAASSVPLSVRHGFNFSGQLISPEVPQSHSLIRLDKNENAYGPSDKVKQAMADSMGLANRYPDPECGQLSETLGALHHVKTEEVVLGCGSSEILRMAATAFLGSGKGLVIASPTFTLIADYARRMGASVTAIPLTKRYAHDLEAMRASIRPSTGLVYICNPNNPTGSITPRQNLEAFIRDLPRR